jgi:hypothetical protein
MDLSNMNRRDKFDYLKAKDIPFNATITNDALDALCRGEEVIQDKPKRRSERKRVPLGTHRQKLNVDGYDIPPDKVARWINDHPGRLDTARNGGYTFVRDPKKSLSAGEDPLRVASMGDSVSAIVGTQESGQPLTAYLMVIDKDLYEEDKKAKEAEMDKTDAAIRRGVGSGVSEDGMYAADGGVKYNPNQ